MAPKRYAAERVVAAQSHLISAAAVSTDKGICNQIC